jgi:hypothetical protein
MAGLPGNHYEPGEAAMSLLHVLTGLRPGRRGVRDGSGMLLIMLALSGLLANKAAKRNKGPGRTRT